MSLEMLIGNVESSADWRAEKAKQYPDDKRNVRSSEALKELARNLRQIPAGDETAVAYSAVVDRLVDLDEGDRISEYESPFIGRYGFDYPTDGDAADFLSVLVEEYQGWVKEAEERQAEEEREQAYEAASEAADEQAREVAHEAAEEIAKEVAREVAEQAYKEAYDEAYKEAYEEAYKEALIEALGS